MKRWFVVVFLALFSFLFKSATFASSEFGTTYSAYYQANDLGATHVEMRIGLRNKISNVYADKFSLSVGFVNLSNVKVRDETASLEPVISTTQNQTTITFQSAGKVVGKDKVKTFIVSFDTLDIAVKNGSVWEVNIPPLEADKDIESQTVTLEVPGSWGKPAFIEPKVNETSGVIGPKRYVFGNQVLGNGPISAVFGTNQYVKFEVKYNLENLSPVKNLQEVALIPKNNYQDVYYEQISPRPSNVRVDNDGNWLASFIVEPGKSVQVVATGYVKLSFEPAISPLTADEAVAYLQPTTLWESDSEPVKSLAMGLKTPSAIFDYVTDKLSYDYTKIKTGPNRQGALYALENPLTAICTEFSDVFIALNRGAGVPARELEGYAFTNNSQLRPLSLATDVLHSWPEYYDYSSQRWIAVDPTWTVTTGGVDYFHKMDLNHVVFVIHGTDPVKPLPVGAYKKASSSEKDIEMTPTVATEFPPYTIDFSLKSNLWKNEYVLVITNTGKVVAEPNLSVTTEGLDIINYQGKLIIPPFGSKELILPVSSEPGIGIMNAELVVKYDGKTVKLPGKFRRETPTTFFVAGLVGLGVIIAAVAFTTFGIRLRRRKKKTFVYWEDDPSSNKDQTARKDGT